MTERERQTLLNRITVDSDIQGGRPVTKGTRVPVARVIGALSAGATAKELEEDYGLQAEDIRAALAYAAKAMEDAEVHDPIAAGERVTDARLGKGACLGMRTVIERIREDPGIETLSQQEIEDAIHQVRQER